MAPRYYKAPDAFQGDINYTCMEVLGLPLSVTCAQLRERSHPDVFESIETVCLWTLVMRVLPRLEHVSDLKDRQHAVKRVDAMISRGGRKLFRTTKRSKSTPTAERGLDNITSLISTYLQHDIFRCLGIDRSRAELHEAMNSGEVLLFRLEKCAQRCTVFAQVPPIVILGFVFSLVEIMLFQETHSYVDTNSWSLDDPDLPLAVIGQVCREAFLPFHTGAGILCAASDSEGGTELHPFAFSRGDEVAARMGMAAAIMRHVCHLMNHVEADGAVDESLEADSELPSHEFYGTAIRSLSSSGVDSKAFRKFWKLASQRCAQGCGSVLCDRNDLLWTCVAKEAHFTELRSSLLASYNGPGVATRSKFIPAIVRMDTSAIQEKLPASIQAVLGSIGHEEAANSRAIRVTEESVSVQCPSGSLDDAVRFHEMRELCCFLTECIQVANEVALEYTEVNERADLFHEPGMKYEEYRRLKIHELFLGSFSSDLSGKISAIYEELIFGEFMARYNERNGLNIVRKLSTSRRAISPKRDDKRRAIHLKKVTSDDASVDSAAD